MNFILQGAFWCKGNSPGGFTGNFFDSTEAAIIQFKRDIGLTNPNGVVTAKVMVY